MSSKSRSVSTKTKRTFEEAIAEVEMIVQRLEDGKLGLAQSLDEYQKGVGTLKECHELLSEAERRITLLSGFDADGNPVLEPFEQVATVSDCENGDGPIKTARNKIERSQREPTRSSEPGLFTSDDLG